MSFISSTDHVTLGDGVYNNIRGNLNNIVNNYHFYGRKRHREEIADAPELSSMEPLPKRRRHDGIKVIRNKYLKLKLEIGSGTGYLLHAGEAKGRAVIVKVFDGGPTVLEQLESTMALSKGLMHPNVLRIEGVSSSASLSHFIVYENAYWKTAEGPLAAALKNDLAKSVTLGFKMIAGLSSGMNYLSIQGIELGVENFDIFLDVDDRFLISISPSAEGYVADDQYPEDNTNRPWVVFNALCQKVLRSANRVLHDEDIPRNPVVLDLGRRHSVPQKSVESFSIAPPLSFDSDMEDTVLDNAPSIPVPPRREYVWRTIDCGQQSLANIASRISRDLDISSVSKLTWSDVRSAHRCAGYVREEITLATTMDNSAVVSHDAPSPLEVCSICHEVVGVHEVFRCICDDPSPGSRTTVKCQTCKFWSHSACVGNPSEFTCQLCSSAEAKFGLETAEPKKDSKKRVHFSPAALSLPPKKKSKPSPKVGEGRMRRPIDYDRQCGVINNKGLPCSRSLGCHSHSIEAKRAVQGRSRKYGDLLIEWQRAHNPNFVDPANTSSYVYAYHDELDASRTPAQAESDPAQNEFYVFDRDEASRRMRMREAMHQPRAPFPCTQPGCESAFFVRRHYLDHVKDHKNGIHRCQACGAACETPSLLHYHREEECATDGIPSVSWPLEGSAVLRIGNPERTAT
ncbi:SCA7, zinc-binding domain-containing protein [Mycena vulgaris]|nr:SCA7, zinc-binding domain-containing protein [Mycena vulgaris]